MQRTKWTDTHPKVSPRWNVDDFFRKHKLKTRIRRPFACKGRQACEAICPLPVSLPHRLQKPQLWGDPELPRWTPTYTFWASNTYLSPKPFLSRFGIYFEPILGSKLVPESSQNRIKINVAIRLRFLIDFSCKMLCYIKLPIQSNHQKTIRFFNILVHSTCYKLLLKLIKAWIHFAIKINQNFSKNLSKNHIAFKVGFGNTCFLFFDCFQLDFGPILVPKWAAFCCWKRHRKRYQAQAGLQRRSRPHLGPLRNRFGNIFEQFLIKFGHNFKANFPSKARRYTSISRTLLYLHRSSKLKTQNRSYLKPQGVSEILSTLILKEMLHCVFLEGFGSAKVMSSDENITGP